MTNLVPEQRVDKNGRLVTRHIRGNAHPAFGKRSRIPAPKAHYYDATAAVEDYMETLVERGAESGNVPAIADALAAVSEETRIIAMTALHDHEDNDATLMLSYALVTKDEQFIRSVSLSLGYCADYVRTLASREDVDPSQYKTILGGLHNTHKSLVHSSSNGVPLAEYDRERDELIATAFKAEHLARFVNMSRKVDLKFEYYQHQSLIAGSMEEIEAATPTIVELVAARRHHAIASKESTDALALDAHDLISIADIVSDYPHADKQIYDIVVGHGVFDPDRIRLALENEAPALVQGVL